VTNTNVFQTVPARWRSAAEVLRNGARALLAQAVEAEVAADKLTNDGRQRPVRHGRLPEREIVTGIRWIAKYNTPSLAGAYASAALRETIVISCTRCRKSYAAVFESRARLRRP
jgi:hypothetical protein